MTVFHLSTPVLVCIILLISALWTIHLFRKTTRKKSSPNVSSSPVVSIPESKAEKYEFTIPDMYQGLPLAYRYIDVKIIPVKNGSIFSMPGEPLKFMNKVSGVFIYQGSDVIGQMETNNISKMVIEWLEKGDPFLAFVSKYSNDDSSAEIAIAFYSDLISKFKTRNPDAQLFKLSGKPEELSSYSVGQSCSIDYDIERDKYTVQVDGSIIGVLPAAAVKYASDHGIEADDLDVIIASVDYDIEKDRDIISVYISE